MLILIISKYYSNTQYYINILIMMINLPFSINCRCMHLFLIIVYDYEEYTNLQRYTQRFILIWIVRIKNPFSIFFYYLKSGVYKTCNIPYYSYNHLKLNINLFKYILVHFRERIDLLVFIRVLKYFLFILIT